MNLRPSPSHPQVSPVRDRLKPLVVELLFYAVLTYVVILATSYFAVARPKPTPILLFVFGTINLYVHEAGHFFFQVFGRTMHILGGSLFEVAFPFALFVYAALTRWRFWPFPLFYTGLAAMSVSMYARDAPYRRLPLIAGLDKSHHDWWNLLLRWNAMGSAETIADWLYAIGVLVGWVAVLAGLFLAFDAFFRPKVEASPTMKKQLEELMRKQKAGPQ
jgi:hypothetical protein